MARPVNANAAATRQRILTTASRLFAERGVGQTSIRLIARESSVSLAMVHHYFGSKEDLHRDCIDAMYKELGQLQDEFVELVRDPPDSMESVIDSVMRRGFRFGIEHRSQLRLLMRSIVDTGGIGLEWRERELIPTLTRFSRLVGALTGKNPERMRLTIQSVVFMNLRYVVAAPDELAAIAGMPPEDIDAVYQAVEDHLADVAKALVLS